MAKRTGTFDRNQNPGTAVCAECGRRRQMANMEADGTVCIDCWEVAGLVNEHSDRGTHECFPEGIHPDCPTCHPDIDQKENPVTTPKTATRKPGQKRTATEKVADGKARRDAQKAKAATKAAIPADNRQRTCSAPKCEELRSTKRGILCESHERQWRHEGFRLTPEATKRAKAKLAEQAKERDARKAARAKAAPKAKAAKPKDNVVRMPNAVAVEDAQPDQHAIAAFASLDLAAKAAKKRAARNAPRATR